MKQFLIACLFALAMGAGFSTQAADNKQDWYLVTDQGLRCRMDSVSYLVAADDDQFFNVVIIDGVFSFVQQVSFETTGSAGIQQPRAEQEALKPMLVHGVLHISSCQAGKEALIYTLEGKSVIRQSLAGEQVDIDVSQLPKGMYLLQVGSSAVRFFKQ